LTSLPFSWSDPSTGTNIPIDALSNLLEGKLKFADTEKDMVAMFHAITGKMPDGSYERHESRLLGFGKPGGDTSMAETVGYTTGLFPLPV
jgi:saccharopine dehydrogenase (NADP+, L-glutamate forming)